MSLGFRQRVLKYVGDRDVVSFCELVESGEVFESDEDVNKLSSMVTDGLIEEEFIATDGEEGDDYFSVARHVMEA